MKNFLKKSILAACAAAALNLIFFSIAFGVLHSGPGSRQGSGQKQNLTAGQQPGKDAGADGQAVKNQAVKNHEVKNPDYTLVFLIGGFVIVLGLSAGFYIYSRRLSRSIKGPDKGPGE